MSKKRDDLQRQINHLNTLIDSKKKEIENLELQLSITHQYASNFTHVPAKTQLEIKDLEERIKQANIDLPSLIRGKEQLQTENDQIIDEIQPQPWGPTSESKINSVAIFLGGILIIIVMVAIWLDIQVFYPRFTNPIIYEQMIDPNFHHLGDNAYSEEYINSISGDKIHNITAEGLTYQTTFDLLSIRRAAKVGENEAIKKVEMTVYVNALKPRETAPVILGVNGHLVTYLNDLITREEFRRTMITILLDVPLREGQNEIEIITGKDTEQNIVGVDEYEDFEFDSLALQVTFDATRLNLFPFLGLILVELLLSGGVFALLQRSLG